LVGTDVKSNLVWRELDSKAMRKVAEGSDIAITLEAGLTGSGCVVQLMGRFLVKLH